MARWFRASTYFVISANACHNWMMAAMMCKIVPKPENSRSWSLAMYGICPVESHWDKICLLFWFDDISYVGKWKGHTMLSPQASLLLLQLKLRARKSQISIIWSTCSKCKISHETTNFQMEEFFLRTFLTVQQHNHIRQYIPELHPILQQRFFPFQVKPEFNRKSQIRCNKIGLGKQLPWIKMTSWNIEKNKSSGCHL